MKILEILYYLATILGLLFLIWYAIETYKLRKATQKQINNGLRTFITFLPTLPPFEVKNFSSNVAVNVFIFTRENNNFYFKDDAEAVFAALPAGQTLKIERTGFKQITQQELARRMLFIQPLLNYLNSRNINSFIVVYEDLLGNKLYTILNGSGDRYDKAGETGYIVEL